MAYMPQFPACANPANQFHLDFEADMNKMHVDANRHIHCDQCASPTVCWQHEIQRGNQHQCLGA